MGYRIRIVISAALVATAAAVLVGQQPAPGPSSRQDRSSAPVFRSGVEAVQVDVYVTDEHDKPVTGLTVDDFDVFENGKPQAITTFAPVNIPIERSEPLPFGAEPDVQANNRPAGHVFLFLLGQAIAGGDPALPLRTRYLVRKFIEDHFGDNDIAAVVTGGTFPGDRQDFTSNRRLLLNAVDRFDGTGLRAWEFRDLMETMARIPGGRKSVLWFTNEGLPGPYYKVGGRQIDAFDLIDSHGELLSLAGEQVHAALASATQANIRFYVIDPEGLTPGFGPLDHNMNFRALGEMTGGFAQVGSNTFAEAYERIISQTSTYYVLGFNSSGQKRDGRYVRLEVRVKRPGLKVKSRSGYLQQAKYILLNTPPEPVRTPLEAALANPLATSGVGMRVFAAPYRKSGRDAEVALAIDLDAASLAFAEKNGTFSANLEIRHLATDENHLIYPEHRHRTAINLDAGNHRRVMGGGIRIVSQFDVPRGRYQIRVASASGDRNGSVVYDLVVPDFGDGPLTLSGVSLATLAPSDAVTLRPGKNRRSEQNSMQCRTRVCAASVVLDSALAPWQQSASSADAPLLRDVLPAPPTTAREFASSDTLALFAEVYDNNEQVAKDPPYTIALTATLHDAESIVVRHASEQRSSRDTRRPSGGHGFTLRLPLEGVPAGSYVLRVEATSGRDEAHKVSRSIPMQVR